MTETKILELLRDDFKGVTASVNNLTGEVAGMKSDLNGVNDTLKEHRAAIKETREDQLSCKAAGGWGALNREMKSAKNRIRDDRVYIESKMDDLREDQTGQVDVHALPAEKRFNGSLPWPIIKTLGPLLLAVFLGILGLGFYLGSGGDEEKTLQVLRNLREIGLKVEKIEKNKAEPVRVPVPVTAADLYSEEIIP